MDKVNKKDVDKIDGELDLPYQEYDSDTTPDVAFGARDLLDSGKTVNANTIRKDYYGSKDALVYEGYIPTPATYFKGYMNLTIP